MRKLEFIIAEALKLGADTLITGGGIQSNHCRLTSAVAAKEGLKCCLVLQESEPNTYNPKASGNNLLFQLLGVERVIVAPRASNLSAEMEKVVEDMSSKGQRPYLIPIGASTPLGALGYIACAEEILSQTFDAGLSIGHVVCASGSAGTQSGLIVGFFGNNTQIQVIGINVSRSKVIQEERVYDLSTRAAAFAGIKHQVPRDVVLCFDGYVGPGYAQSSSEMIASVKLVARTEGILLDPVYTGKAMAGLIDLVRKGYFRKDENIVFVHTGGSAALFAYVDEFIDR